MKRDLIKEREERSREGLEMERLQNMSVSPVKEYNEHNPLRTRMYFYDCIVLERVNIRL